MQNTSQHQWASIKEQGHHGRLYNALSLQELFMIWIEGQIFVQCVPQKCNHSWMYHLITEILSSQISLLFYSKSHWKLFVFHVIPNMPWEDYGWLSEYRQKIPCHICICSLSMHCCNSEVGISSLTSALCWTDANQMWHIVSCNVEYWY